MNMKIKHGNTKYTEFRTFSFRTFCASVLVLFACSAYAGDLKQQVEKIMARPEFKHSMFGVDIYSLDKHKHLYAYNAEKFFTAASTTKLVTTGAALQLFGDDYRFHTKVYRTGEISNDGVLDGDLVLVASGDPNLSGRVGADDTLAFENEDHSYGGPDSHGVPGDPLLVIRKLAAAVARQRIKRINGKVLVDASLFAQGEKEKGTGVVIAPIIVNDNLVDCVITAGANPGDPATLKIAPQTAYVRIMNLLTTVKADAEPEIDYAPDVENSDGSHTVTLTGNVPAGKSAMFAYPVSDPTRYAEFVFVEALREQGILANARLKEETIDFKALAANYVPGKMVAEHVSPPITQEIKVILKVSQNLHASLMPYLYASLLAKKDPPQAGFDLMKDFLTKANLDLSGTAQSDGAGGAARFTPAFMVSYLTYMTTRKDASVFHDALPVLGKDGTLFKIQTNSPAAGHVSAKTGTWIEGDLLNQDYYVGGKGLAGYITTRKGEHLAFAAYISGVRVPPTMDAPQQIVGQALGEIAAAAYEAN